MEKWTHIYSQVTLILSELPEMYNTFIKNLAVPKLVVKTTIASLLP